MDVKISVIIPAFNVCGYFCKCLESIKDQTMREFEVIIIDDGSTDGTQIIAEEYAQKDQRFHVIHQENQGVSAARNHGITHAKGEFILFFDGDDFVEQDCLENLYVIMTDEKVDILLYGYYRYEDNTIIQQCYPMFSKTRYYGDEILEQVLPQFIGLSTHQINQWMKGKEQALYVENPALWRAMLKREVIMEHNIRFQEQLRIGEDTIFISEYLSYAKDCYVLQQCFYYLVTRETSAIYQYEKSPDSKLEGKLRLLEARNRLAKEIFPRRKYDISGDYQGTIIMSCIELALLFAKKNKLESRTVRYQNWLSYCKREEVLAAVEGYHIRMKQGLKSIPFILLKRRCYKSLFYCASILQLVHFQFHRN